MPHRHQCRGAPQVACLAWPARHCCARSRFASQVWRARARDDFLLALRLTPCPVPAPIGNGFPGTLAGAHGSQPCNRSMLQPVHAACIGASRARHRCGAWWRVRRTCLRCAQRFERWQAAPEWNRMGMASPAPSRVPMVPNHDVLQRRSCLFLGAAPRRSRPICSRAPNSRAPLALRSWAPRATRQAPLPRALLAGVDLGARFARGGCSVEQSVHWCTWCSNAQVSGGCHGARPTRWHGC